MDYIYLSILLFTNSMVGIMNVITNYYNKATTSIVHSNVRVHHNASEDKNGTNLGEYACRNLRRSKSGVSKKGR